MATIEVTDPAREVLNQAPPLQPVNLFDVDLALHEALEREGGAWGVDRAREAGRGRRQRRDARALAAAPSATCRSCAPTTGSATGSTRSSSTPPGTGCCAARSSARSTAFRGATTEPGAHVVRAALFTLWGNANDGVMCPVSMTYAAIPALRDGAPGAGGRVGAAADEARLRRRRAGRDGDDRAPGRLGRAGQHHPRRAAPATACTSCTATSGSAPIRRATCSWCWRRRPAASRASSSSAAPGWSSSG